VFRRLPKSLSLSVLAVFALALLLFVRSAGTGKLVVAFLDIGQGDALYIKSPSGRQAVIDGGPSNALLKRLREVMPPFDRSIDLVIATHPDKDHIAGLPALFDRYTIGSYGESGVRSSSTYDLALAERVRREGLRPLLPKRGDVFDLGSGVSLTILFPDRDVSGVETNTSSIVALLSYGKTRMLLMGDAPLQVERYLVALDPKALESDVLKVGHHGSKTSTVGELLEAVSPRYAVISAAKDNSYGHPHAEVVARLRAASSTILSTAERGTIMIESDGVSLRVLDGE
jgi:competence protein ComEC